jgi:hypothetical protein
MIIFKKLPYNYFLKEYFSEHWYRKTNKHTHTHLLQNESTSQNQSLLLVSL